MRLQYERYVHFAWIKEQITFANRIEQYNNWRIAMPSMNLHKTHRLCMNVRIEQLCHIIWMIPFHFDWVLAHPSWAADTSSLWTKYSTNQTHTYDVILRAQFLCNVSIFICIFRSDCYGNLASCTQHEHGDGNGTNLISKAFCPDRIPIVSCAVNWSWEIVCDLALRELRRIIY